MKVLLTMITAAICLGACSTNNQTTEQGIAETSDTSRVLQAGNINALFAEKKNIPSDIQIGMRDEKVRALLGKPTKIDIINEELGERVEDWWYGSNQKVRITGGQVTRVVQDVDKEQSVLEKIKEAKERGDDAEAKRLTNEMYLNN